MYPMTSLGGLLSRYDVTLQRYLSGYAFHVESDIQKSCTSRRKKGCLKIMQETNKCMECISFQCFQGHPRKRSEIEVNYFLHGKIIVFCQFLFLHIHMFSYSRRRGSDGVWKSVTIDSELYDTCEMCAIKDPEWGSAIRWMSEDLGSAGGWLLRREWAGGTAPSPSLPLAPTPPPTTTPSSQNQMAGAETARLLSLMIIKNGKLKVNID